MDARIANREQAHAWELRVAWGGRRQIVVVLDPDVSVIPRLAGTVERVSPTGAFALILEDGDAEPWSIPCSAILAVRKPHFSEPLDRRPPPPPGDDVMPGQLSLLDRGADTCSTLFE